MPPINQQGSRAGLITALVVFAILFITSSIFAFQYYSKYQQAFVNLNEYKKRYNEILPDQPTPAQATVIDALRTQKNGSAQDATHYNFGITQADSIFDISTKQSSILATIIHGNAGTSDVTAPAAADDAIATINASSKLLKDSAINLTLSPVGLTGDITSLTNELVAETKLVSTMKGQLNDLNTELSAAKAGTAALGTSKDQELDNVRKKAAADLATAQAATDAVNASYKQMQDNVTANGAQTQAALAAKDAELAAVNQKILSQEKLVTELKSHFANRRPQVESTVLRQSDGKLVRVASNGVCYINLGKSDHITPGLTFEVYDKTEGVPGLPANAGPDEQLPVGKGSIEITNIGETSSECRIIRTTPGAILGEGDLIANLVYDPHIKYNFVVYGKYDLGNTGRPNDPDAEVIKRLVTQWGGKVEDQVDVNTDFVVLGTEPVVPNFSKDEETAENAAKREAAQKALQAYNDVKVQAEDLHIPILNQNRFLYYVGFYDQAKR